MHGKIVLAATALSLFSSAAAHLGHDDIVRVIDRGHQIDIMITIETASLTTCDENDDGVMIMSEFDQCRDEINAWVDEGMSVRDPSFTPLTIAFSDLTVPGVSQHRTSAEVSFVRIRRSYFADPSDTGVLLSSRLSPLSHEKRRISVRSEHGAIAGTIDLSHADTVLRPAR